MKFCELLKNRRLELGKSEDEVRKMFNIGLNRYSSIESGNSVPSFDRACLMLHRLGVESIQLVQEDRREKDVA